MSTRAHKDTYCALYVSSVRMYSSCRCEIMGPSRCLCMCMTIPCMPVKPRAHHAMHTKTGFDNRHPAYIGAASGHRKNVRACMRTWPATHAWQNPQVKVKRSRTPVLENTTTEPHAQDFSADILRVWLSGYILQHPD